MEFMDQSFEQIAAAALRLSSEEREALVETLLASLGPEPGHDDAWAEELERRLTELASGVAREVSYEQALAKAEALLK